MKVTAIALGICLCTGTAFGQNPSKTGAQIQIPSDPCGPIGCLAPSEGTTPEVRTGGPVVIRSDDAASQTSGQQTNGQEEAGQAVGTTTMASASVAKPVIEPLPTAFEQFVTDSIGHRLPIFGRELFRGTGEGFAPSTSVAPPSDYVLGTGDEVIIRTFGKINIDAHAMVDRNGTIFIPQVGTLTVAGMRLDRLTDFIRDSIAQQFKGFDLTVSLGRLRTIQIFVLGQASAPGVYTISSLSTLVNALFASGGPSPNGTMRDIQVKRAGGIITHFDVYRLLLKGDKSADVRLLPGDIIYIPPVGPQVALDGDVHTPAIYELAPGSSTVGETIADAGGLTPVAGTARAVLEHIIDHSRRSVEDLKLNNNGLAIKLQDGDILRVFPVSSRIEDAVTIRGNVAEPGRYAWHPGMRVSDLIPSRNSLLTRAYFNHLNQLDVPNQEHPFGIAVPKPADPAATQAINDPPQIDSHATEINWNYAAIERLDPSDLTTQIISFDLGDAIDHPDSADNKTLEAGDVVVVYSQKDVALPLELRAKFVRIDGQVKAPGVYRISDNETLRDLVKRAGGLEPHSYLYAAQLTRESVRIEQEQRLKALIAQESQDVLSPSNLPRSANGAGPSSADLDLRKAYIAELSKVKPTGRVVLQLKPEGSTTDDVPEFQLEDGDHFFVPTIPNTVDVLGSVYNEGALRFLQGNRAAEYLNAAGGATRDGDHKREFIIRADGTIVSKQKVHGLERLKLFPGDAVVVPPKLKPGFSGYDFLNFTQIISAFALSAVAIKALQ